MIWLMRHGEIETGGEKRFIGQIDLPLSKTGKAQVRCQREAMASVRFDAVYCSDLTRTRQTARIMAQGRGTEIRAVPELREIDLGEWDGLPMAEVRALFPKAWRERGQSLPAFRPPGGESFADLQARVVPVVEQIAARHPGNILIVTHAGVNRVILCHILGMPLANLFRLCQDYACLNKIIYKNNTWIVTALNQGAPAIP